MPSLDSRYPDLLPAPRDPALHQIVSRLDRAYGPENPNVGPPSEWRAHLALTLARRASETMPRRARLHRLLLHPRRNAAFALVFTVAALGAAILGLALTDNPSYETPNPPPSYMVRALNLYGHAVNQSWQSCGYTISVVRTYADANRAIVEWTIHGPSYRTFAGLEGRSGIAATGFIPGSGHRTRLQPIDAWLGGMKHNTVAMYATFDTHQIAYGAAPLHLQLHLPSFSAVEPLEGNSTTPSGCEHISGMSGLPPQSLGSPQDYARGFVTRWIPSLFPRPLAYTVEINHDFTMPITLEPGMDFFMERQGVGEVGGG